MHALRITGIAIAATLFLSASVAFAEEGSRSGVAPRVKSETVRAELKERAMTTASTTKTQVREIKEAAQESAKAAREEARERTKTVREDAQERVKAIREDAQERVKTLRENAKQRVSDLRDKKKQETARKLAARLEELNKTWTDHFAKLIDRYDAMVAKMQKRAATAAANGKDVSAANAAIQSARDAVATAKAAVAMQAAKTYTLDASAITTTTASTTPEGQDELVKALKASFQTLHKTLFTDLYALRDGAMKAARAAIQNALQTLGKVPDVDKAVVPTDSAGSSQ